VLNFDPDSIKSRLFSKAPAASSLDALDAIVKGGVDATLKIHGIKDGWVPRAPSEMPETSFGGQTATEVGASAAPLGLAKTDLYLSHPIAGREAFIQAPQELARTAAEQRTNAAGKSSNYGLAPTDDDAARALITRAKGSSDEERARIVDTLAQPMLKGKPFDPTTRTPRPSGRDRRSEPESSTSSATRTPSSTRRCWPNSPNTRPRRSRSSMTSSTRPAR